MATSRTMYRSPKLVNTPVGIELPSAMYRMAPINTFSNADLASSYYGSTCSTNLPQGEISGLAELEVRQEAVLERLQSLKQQLDKLQLNKGITSQDTCAVPAVGAAAQSSPIKSGIVHDMVISANPDKPPYSLVLLRKLLKDAGFPVYCANHLHSSIKEVNQSVRSVFTDSPEGDRSKHSLAFTLHWKDVSSPSLMVNPLRQTQITGEGNIVRYISRLFPLSSLFNYEATGTFTSITETDNLLDQLMSQMLCGNNKEQQAVLRQLNGRLGRKCWLMGDKCSIVDVMAWSAMKQTALESGAPANVSKWYKSVNTLAGLVPSSAMPQGTVISQKVKNDKNETTSKNTSKEVKNDKNETSSKDTNKEVLGNNHHLERTGLEQHFKKLDIKYQVQDHPEVFTVEQLMQYVSQMSGLHMKNLFLKDKKKNLYLLSARHDAEVKLSDVGKHIGVKDLRFGDESVMFDIIGVKQGCVTAYALVNDKNHKIKFLLDSEAFNESHPFINFHPMSNAATLGMSPANFKRFLSSTGHEPTLLTF